MKKKTIIILLVSLCGLIFLTGRAVFADDNGKLQLNPNVITNSNAGVGTTSDFPIRNELFTATLNQVVKEQMQDKTSEHRRAISFSTQTIHPLYAMDTTKINKQLFVNYSPQVLLSSTDNTGTGTMIWYWLLSLLALPLVFLAVFLGGKNAKRNLRKKK